MPHPVAPIDPAVPAASAVLAVPTPLPASHLAEALETVEFEAVLAHVAGFCAGPLGAERLRARRPVGDLAWIREELAAVEEVAALYRRGDALLSEGIPDVRAGISRLRLEGSVLDGRELVGIGRVIAAARRIDADLGRVAELAPRAAAMRVPLPARGLDRRLEQSFDDEGNLLDSASPRLAAARREVHNARARLIRRLEGVLRHLDPQAVPSGANVTVRGGRYVIPVRRDARGRPHGLVHDESASANTLFLEPAETIDDNNALREALVAEERETLRVLRELTDLARPEHEAIRAAFHFCVAVDDLVARARYLATHGGVVPEVHESPAPLVLRDARHPLLLAAGGTVVPFTLELDARERTLLVTGPNTGGKTVLLKAAMLAVALAQSGVAPPVGEGSALPLCTRFFAEIGDRQSIAASLSTFSAHVATLRRILDEADDASLVLLDEVGSGTDPAEGGSLAAAALVALTRRGTRVLATTHYGALKTLAEEEPGIVNGSLHFDEATLAPTYRFAKGVPGRSYGLAIARRLGVPEPILVDAERRVPAAERELDALLASVETRQRELAAAQEAHDALRLETDNLAARLQLKEEALAAREAELQRREKTAERDAKAQARRYLMDARKTVEDALGLAKQAADDAKAKEARRRVEEAIQEEGRGGRGGRGGRQAGDPASATSPTSPTSLYEPGMRIRAANGLTGEVLEVRGDERLLVRVGSMKMVLDTAGLTILSRAERRKESASARAASGGEVAPPDANFEIDLRGMTGDEAEAATVAAVDAAVLAEQPFLRIIHGMGTGVVRERVRRVVEKDRRVARFALAPREQGGAGVTIVEFSA